MASDPAMMRKKLWKILDNMRDNEIDLVTFLEEIMASNEPRLKNIASGFLDRGGFKVVLRLMLRHLGFEGKVKHSTRCLTAVNQALGSEIWPVISAILEGEVNAYCKSPEAGKTAGTMTPETLKEFSLVEMRKRFDHHCPQLSQIITAICSNLKDCQSGTEPTGLEEFESNEPQTVASDVAADEDLISEEVTAEEPPGTDIRLVINTKKRRLVTKNEIPASKRRRARDKNIIGTVCLGVLAFGHSRNANLLQIILGYYLQGYSVAKEVVLVLNRLGLTVAYNTITESMNTLAKCNWEKIRCRINEGEPFGYAIDNCVIGDNKKEQSVLNRKETLQYTAGFLWFLNLPNKEKWKEASLPNDILGESPSPVNSTEMTDLEMNGTGGKGIDRKLLFRGIPNYEGIDSL